MKPCNVCGFVGCSCKPVIPSDSQINQKQVGGEHYKSVSIQPWDYVAANGLGYFEGTVLKYITRWNRKGGGGLDDLQKAQHFLEKLIEIEQAKDTK